MPRTPNQVDFELLEALKCDVLIAYNKPLNRSSDCDKIAAVVSTKTKENINGISFKRLFGFTKYPFNPSIQTLDILAKFIGKKSWHNYSIYSNQNEEISFAEIELIESIYKFDFINQVHNYEGGIQNVSRIIAKRIREHPKSFKKLIYKLAKNPNAQIFLIEHFPEYDTLIPYYWIAFEEYLKNKKSQEAQLFGNCMLFLKSFWECDLEKCTILINEINSIGIHSKIHPYVLGRYFACNLLYNFHFSKQDLKHLIERAFYWSEKMPTNGPHFMDFPAFQYIVSEALMHCEEYVQCISMVNESFKNYSLKMEFVRKGYYRQFLLFKSISMFKLGMKKESLEIVLKINPTNFYFFSQKYYTALLLIHKLRFEDNSFLRKQAKKLIDEMKNRFLWNQLQQIQNEREYCTKGNP